MAVRYSGDLVIRVRWIRWHEGKDEYVSTVTDGRRRWSGRIRLSFFMIDPRSPTGYDKAAEAAMKKSKLPGGEGHVSREFECPCPGHVPPRKRASRPKR